MYVCIYVCVYVCMYVYMCVGMNGAVARAEQIVASTPRLGDAAAVQQRGQPQSAQVRSTDSPSFFNIISCMNVCMYVCM